MKVFILGYVSQLIVIPFLTLIYIGLDSATGFIGFPAAQALVRAGHRVYGLARSAAKAQLLAAEESVLYSYNRHRL